MASAMVQVNVRIPPELHAKLLRAAKGQSVTDVVRAALEKHLTPEGRQQA
jgi:hypothetical protein